MRTVKAAAVIVVLPREHSVLALRFVRHRRALGRTVRVPLAVEVLPFGIVAHEAGRVHWRSADGGFAGGVGEVDADVLHVARRPEVGGAVLDTEVVAHRALVLKARTNLT